MFEVKKDCFAYENKKCLALSELVCKKKKCSFYKLKGTQCDTCSRKGESDTRCKMCKMPK